MKIGRIKAGLAAVAGAGAVAWLAAAEPGAAEESPIDALVAALSSQAASGFAGLEQQLKNLDPMLIKAAAPIVAGMIVDSRDEALAHGVEEIPDAIRAELEGYVSDPILDRARWCAACGGELSLQQNTFKLELSPAITLDYVIVFRDRADALGDPSLWAHELKHVMQYEEWGVPAFAARYLEDYEAVEREAAEYRWEWMKRTGFLERRKAEAARAAGERERRAAE